MPLNPGQFKGPLYHGTTHDIDGRDIVPAKKLDEAKSVWKDHGHSGQKSANHAFATEDEGTAWEFGSQAGMMKRAGGPQPDRVRVHEVAPHPLMRPGVFHADHPAHNGGEDLKEWVAPSFRSKGTIDIMPGRQGTFPTLNWNQFRGEHSGYWSDMNHPTDDDIAEGHLPVGNTKAIQDHMVKNGQLNEAPGGTTDEHQMDLFSGKTVGEHAENDDSSVGDYHRNNLFGRL